MRSTVQSPITKYRKLLFFQASLTIWDDIKRLISISWILLTRGYSFLQHFAIFIYLNYYILNLIRTLSWFWGYYEDITMKCFSNKIYEQQYMCLVYTYLWARSPLPSLKNPFSMKFIKWLQNNQVFFLLFTPYLKRFINIFGRKLLRLIYFYFYPGF